MPVAYSQPTTADFAGLGRLHVFLGCSAPACDKVDPTTIKINGVTVDPLSSYRVTVNSFLADGGDSFPTLKLGTNRLGGDVDTDALRSTSWQIRRSPLVRRTALHKFHSR